MMEKSTPGRLAVPYLSDNLTVLEGALVGLCSGNRLYWVKLLSTFTKSETQ